MDELRGRAKTLAVEAETALDRLAKALRLSDRMKQQTSDDMTVKALLCRGAGMWRTIGAA
jgi:hypothetical protein